MEEIKIGLWSKKSKSGKEYFSGKVVIDDKTFWVTMFDKNVNKTNPKAPDYNIIMKLADSNATQTTTNNVADEVDDDDLPF